jgi:pimeloyl-ACP methyl ester carboxylesterase
MKTCFVDSDGVRIAYSVEGEGNAIIHLHGGGDTKECWEKYGYWEDLARDYKVIAVDIRGNGESDKQAKADDYDIKLVMNDVFSVADICGVESFSVIGFSFGAAIGKNLAAYSSRVEKLVMIGHAFGSSVYGEFLAMIPDLRVEWLDIIEKQKAGTLKMDALSDFNKFWVKNYDLPAWRAIISAMPNWGSVGPCDIKCPVMVLYGRGDKSVDNQMKRFEKEVEQCKTHIFVNEELSHYDQFTDSAKNLPFLREFLK